MAQLVVRNRGAAPALLLEGELLDGGYQYRALVSDLLLASGQTVIAPVVCVLDTIDTHLANDEPVLVHRHVGQSRTGLILRDYLMGHQQVDATGLPVLERGWGVHAALLTVAVSRIRAR